MSKTASFWLVAALTAVIAAPAAAQDADRDKARALIAQVMKAGRRPSASRRRSRAQPTGPTVELTSEQAVARALDKNLTLASQRITPETWDLQIAAYLANYKPNLTSRVQQPERRAAEHEPVRRRQPRHPGHADAGRAAWRRTCGGAAATTR